MISILRITVVLLMMALTGCASRYRPLQLDERTSQYPAAFKLQPENIRRFDTSVNPNSFPVVLMLSRSNYRPFGFEFMMRSAFAQLQNTRVFNQEEFLRFASDKKFAITRDKLYGETMQRFSKEVVPVLVVDLSTDFANNAQWYGSITITDGRSGEMLFFANLNQTVFSDVDSEVIYPLLNELRRWYAESSNKTL